MRIAIFLAAAMLALCAAERSAVLQRSHGNTQQQQLEPPWSVASTELREQQQLRLPTLQMLRGGGATLSRLLPILLGRQQCRILMVGLDAAGKTTILYQLKLGEMTNTAPTLGFNVETVSYKNIEFMVWDMGGQDAIRPLWRHYYENAQALIFVVDSADEERMEEAREELSKLMEEDDLNEAVLLVYANKQVRRLPAHARATPTHAKQYLASRPLLTLPPLTYFSSTCRRSFRVVPRCRVHHRTCRKPRACRRWPTRWTSPRSASACGTFRRAAPPRATASGMGSTGSPKSSRRRSERVKARPYVYVHTNRAQGV